MPAFAHTPYDGTSRPFSVGLNRLDLGDWIEPDARLVEALAEKERLWAQDRSTVFAAEPNTGDQQAKTRDLIVDHIKALFPEIYAKKKDAIAIKPADRLVDLGPPEEALAMASRLIHEDLCLLHRDEEGWRLVAAAVFFPSFWRLADKIGRPLADVHGPVPGYADTLARRVDRILDFMPTDQPLWRANWSLVPGPELHRPELTQDHAWAAAGGDPLTEVFVRVERQTIRRVPGVGDILFTIKVCMDPLGDLANQDEGPILARGLKAQLEALSEAQAAYKGVLGVRPALLDALEVLASAPLRLDDPDAEGPGSIPADA